MGIRPNLHRNSERLVGGWEEVVLELRQYRESQSLKF